MYLVGVEPPEIEFLLKQRTTHVGWVVQFAGPVVVENLPQQQHERHTHVDTQREVTLPSLWSRYDRHFVGITRRNVWN